MRPRALHLLTLAIMAVLTSARSMRDVSGDQGSYKKLDIYSALRDPMSGDVRLFLEYHNKHHSQMTEEEKQGPFPSFDDLFASCIFSDYRNFSDSVEVQAKEIHSSAPIGHGWMDCNTRRSYEYVRLKLHSGQVHYQTRKVESIATEHVGSVAACVSPLFSERPDIRDWMYHNTQLGVSRFHMYQCIVHSHERASYEEPHEVWNTVKGFQYREGETTTQLFQPFDHPLAIWHSYSPSNRDTSYFGQSLSFNDCVMRTRYTHDYTMLFDVDEFLYINRTTFGRTGMVQLPDFLDHAFPKMVASLEFASWFYPKNCEATAVGTFFERHKFRDPTHLAGKNGKIIVRPKHVVEVYVHFAVQWAKGWVQKEVIPTDLAFLKHVNAISPAYVHCTNYVDEDTGLPPQP